jgi:hypothetical protein
MHGQQNIKTVAAAFRAIIQYMKRNVKVLHLRAQTRWNEIPSAYFIARKYQPSCKLSEYVSTLTLRRGLNILTAFSFQLFLSLQLHTST